MAKIKCTKCKGGIIGFVKRDLLVNETNPVYDEIILSCIFCLGTGFINEPEKVQEGISCPNKHDRKCIHTSDEGTSYCEKCNVEENEKNQHTDENVSKKPTNDRLDTDGKPKYKVGERFINIFGEHVEIVAISPLPHAGLYPYRVEWNGVYKGHFSEKEIDRWQKIESVTDQSKTYTAEDLKKAKLEVISTLWSVFMKDGTKPHEQWGEVMKTIIRLQKEILNQN